MSNNLRKTVYEIKHFMSQEWSKISLLKESDNEITFLMTNNDISFEEDDKILYSIKRPQNKEIYNSIVTDIDFLDNDKIAVTIRKPIERRSESRYRINLLTEITTNNETFTADVIDISSKGFRLNTKKQMSLKDDVLLHIPLTDKDVVICRAAVIYINPSDNLDSYDYGLKITTISHDNRIVLKDFLSTLN